MTQDRCTMSDKNVKGLDDNTLGFSFALVGFAFFFVDNVRRSRHFSHGRLAFQQSVATELKCPPSGKLLKTTIQQG